MGATTVRIFASHPVALRQYTHALETDRDVRVVSSESAFAVGVFDGDADSVERIIAIARVKSPGMKPVLIADTRDHNQCLRWILRGVWGMVPYARYEQELVAAVHHVAAGQLWVPPPVVKRWMQVDAELHARAQQTHLTEREREVMELLVRRLSNKEIAQVLHITERTVKFHVGNVLAKLGVKSRQDVSTLWQQAVGPV